MAESVRRREQPLPCVSLAVLHGFWMGQIRLGDTEGPSGSWQAGHVVPSTGPEALKFPLDHTVPDLGGRSVCPLTTRFRQSWGNPALKLFLCPSCARQEGVPQREGQDDKQPADFFLYVCVTLLQLLIGMIDSPTLTYELQVD